MTDINLQLNAADLGQPESWKPKPGDWVTGKIIRYDSAESRYGTRWIAVIDPDPIDGVEVDRPYAIWLSHAVLVAKFKELRPAPGEGIGIRRLDDSPKGYAMYRLVVEGRQPAMPAWDDLGDNGEVDL